MDWAKSPERREQLVLFPIRLDEAVGPDHDVRLLDDILGRLNWSAWEAAYDLQRGQTPKSSNPCKVASEIRRPPVLARRLSMP